MRGRYLPLLPLAVLLGLSLALIVGCASAPSRWTAADVLLPSASTVSDVTFAPAGEALVALYEPGGLYGSSDGGDSWEWLGKGLGTLTPLALLPTGPDCCAWVGTVNGLWQVCGSKANRMPGVEGPVYSLAEGRAAIWAAAEAGLFSCTPDGCAATELSQPILVVDSAADFACAGAAGEGLWCSRGTDGDWYRVEAPVGIVNDLTVTADGTVYLVSVGHLYACDPVAGCAELDLPLDAGARALAYGEGGLLVGTAGRGILASRDGGETWIATRGPGAWPEVSALALEPEGTSLAGTVGAGLLIFRGPGAGWEPLAQAPGKRPVYALAESDDGRLYAGTAAGVYRAQAPMGPWQRLGNGDGPTAVYALGWSADSLFAGSGDGVHRWEGDGGWHLATEELGRQTVFALAAPEPDLGRLYAGSWGNNILASDDAGSTWAPVHNGLETLSVYSLATSPFDRALRYAGTVEGLFCTQDSGESWQACGLISETVFALEHSPSDGCTLYAGTTTGVWRTVDCGRSWERLGLAGAVSVHSLLVPEGMPDTLFAGTEVHGVWVSADGGRSWTTWGPEGRSVYALLATPGGELLAGTDDGLYVAPY